MQRLGGQIEALETVERSFTLEEELLAACEELCALDGDG